MVPKEENARKGELKEAPLLSMIREIFKASSEELPPLLVYLMEAIVIIRQSRMDTQSRQGNGIAEVFRSVDVMLGGKDDFLRPVEGVTSRGIT